MLPTKFRDDVIGRLESLEAGSGKEKVVNWGQLLANIDAAALKIAPTLDALLPAQYTDIVNLVAAIIADVSSAVPPAVAPAT